MRRGFGVSAGLDAGVARPLAARCAELGYDSLWANDHPAAKGVDTLAEFAAAAPRADLGVGVISIDRTPPEAIATDLERSGLDPARLWLGVGAGSSRKHLTTMREALPELRERLPGVNLVLAAMGPKMCALGGSAFDGVFFNWMTPEFAALSRERVEAGARDAGRATPPIFGYVRTAVGADSAARLAKEESFYRDLHAGYRDHFARLDEPEGTVGVAASDSTDAQQALAAYTALDTVVVRALTSATVEAMTALAEATAPSATVS